jgi:hypothetical protein
MKSCPPNAERSFVRANGPEMGIDDCRHQLFEAGRSGSLGGAAEHAREQQYSQQAPHPGLLTGESDH